MAEKVVESVVNISTSQAARSAQGSPFMQDPFFREFFGQRGMPPGAAPPEQRAQSLGTGVIVADDGTVLTNNHVVAQADEIQARPLPASRPTLVIWGAEDPVFALAAGRRLAAAGR